MCLEQLKDYEGITQLKEIMNDKDFYYLIMSYEGDKNLKKYLQIYTLLTVRIHIFQIIFIVNEKAQIEENDSA
jgi:hypothetical protein